MATVRPASTRGHERRTAADARGRCRRYEPGLLAKSRASAPGRSSIYPARVVARRGIALRVRLGLTLGGPLNPPRPRTLYYLLFFFSFFALAVLGTSSHGQAAVLLVVPVP